MPKPKADTVPVCLDLPRGLWLALVMAKATGRIKSIKGFLIALAQKALGQ